MPKVSCIIAAYNEAPRIAAVLSTLHGHPLINEVIVVDDGSTDQTIAQVDKFKKVILLKQPKNLGKSKAIVAGLEQATGDFLLLLDADLIGLTAQHITDLVKPVLDGVADMTISLRKNTPWFWRLLGLDYISGERVVPKELLAPHHKTIATLSPFGVETFMNKHLIAEQYRIRVVYLAVSSPYKYKKRGIFAGVIAEYAMIKDVLKESSIFEIIRQIWKMRSLRV